MNRPSLPDAPYTGGCLCGAVRYSYNARPLALNACHCTDCKKLSGSSYFAVVQSRGDAFSFTGETTHHRKTADSGRGVDIHRCATCGTRLWHTPAGSSELVFFAAGTLDDPTWFVPTSHIWASRAQPDVVFGCAGDRGCARRSQTDLGSVQRNLSAARMKPKATDEEVCASFAEVVNMTPHEIEAWRQTEASASVGQGSGDGVPSALKLVNAPSRCSIQTRANA